MACKVVGLFLTKSATPEADVAKDGVDFLIVSIGKILILIFRSDDFELGQIKDNHFSA